MAKQKTFIVTRAFECRGSMWRPGQRIALSEEEAADAFVASHVAEAATGGGGDMATAGYFGNGKPRVREEAPAKVAAQEPSTVAELKAALVKLGVPVAPNMKKDELATLFASAKAALAGGAQEPNRPQEGLV